MQHSFRSIRKPTFTLINVFMFSVVHLERDVVIEHSCALKQRFFFKPLYSPPDYRENSSAITGSVSAVFLQENSNHQLCSLPPRVQTAQAAYGEREWERELENECGRSLGTRRNVVREFSQLSQSRWSVFTNLHGLTKYHGTDRAGW